MYLGHKRPFEQRLGSGSFVEPVCSLDADFHLIVDAIDEIDASSAIGRRPELQRPLRQVHSIQGGQAVSADRSMATRVLTA